LNNFFTKNSFKSKPKNIREIFVLAFDSWKAFKEGVGFNEGDLDIFRPKV
jgi:hypothetical protein